MPESTTDCRSETGITVGLIDALIAIARVLAKRPLDAEPAQQALVDLRGDEDIAILFPSSESYPPPASG